MDLEELSKSQLILLIVFVNFVVSVATGILTVSLLDQAPPVITQTVNRIVEHTIETVAQAAPAAVIQAPQPSVEDLITSAFAASETRLVRIYEVSSGTSTPAIAIGTYLPKVRAVVTIADLSTEVEIEFADGSFAPASLLHTDEILGVYGFADDAVLPTAHAPILIAKKDLKIGQTALALTKNGGAATGIVSRIAEDGTIETTLQGTTPGSAVVDLGGNLIGIAPSEGGGAFITADRIKELLAVVPPPPPSTN